MPTFELVPGQNCWRIVHADQYAAIVDAADYFTAVRKAMLNARKSILLVGWDFDARIDLGKGNTDGGPDRLGDFMPWLASRTPGLQVRLLRWGTGAIAAMFRPSALWATLRWKAHPQITVRLDHVHPLAASHHQKIVIIDDCLAFCGGIDMTAGRWDTSEHLDDDPRRTGPNGKIMKPWHDTTCLFNGDAAMAMGDVGRERWKMATGETLDPCTTCHDCWPEGVTPMAENVQLAIARTLPKLENRAPVHEIETAWVDMINAAEKYIYAESQYFVSRKVAHAIAMRLTEDNPPEIVIVNPRHAEGWLEPIAMDSARAKLVEALYRIDHAKRLRVYHPVTEGGNDIYVHAKIVIADGNVLRIGSSNFNNRSMRLDTECDVILSGTVAGNENVGPFIEAMRDRLISEHLGITQDEFRDRIERNGSLIDTVEALRGTGRTLVDYEIPKLGMATEWLAENEILDPNGPDAMFEPPSKRGLFRGWAGRLRRRMRRKPLALPK